MCKLYFFPIIKSLIYVYVNVIVLRVTPLICLHAFLQVHCIVSGPGQVSLREIVVKEGERENQREQR